MSKIEIDSENLSAEESSALSRALDGLAEADVPLVAELIVTDDATIKSLNRECRGIDAVTDVLSFPSMEGIKGSYLRSDEHAEELDEEDRLFLGSVAVCEKCAREQADSYGHSYERELFYLTVHGVLHCLGYDHETEEERAEMRAMEERVMEKMNLKRS